MSRRKEQIKKLINLFIEGKFKQEDARYKLKDYVVKGHVDE
jgi:hypothetical protein